LAVSLSIYTCVKDAIYWDLHAEAMIRHHLPLADEIIVNEGMSSDGTYERITAIDPKVKVFRSDWSRPEGMQWYCAFKDAARRHCTGDWCLYLDCDEFIPEWDFDRLRSRLEHAVEDLLAIDVLNFYGNFRIFHVNPKASHWPDRKMALHRNRPDVEFWGDGSNVRIHGREFAWPTREHEFVLHHFGCVRNPARLREKWRNQQGRIYGTMRIPIPKWLFAILPHQWNDPDFRPYLAIYDGEPVKAVRDDPDEFVRDGFEMLRLLQREGQVTRTVKDSPSL
jgi:glycosyltransferase involved in cell wall biosynthesis